MTATCLDFFCGAGGSTLGAQQAGLRPIGAVNHWAVAARSYLLNHGIHPLRQSMEQVAPSDLPRADVLLFSPECTNQTRASGKRRKMNPKAEQSRCTALEVTRFVKAGDALAFVVENVPDIRDWERFPGWMADLRALGYALNEDADGPGQLLNAADFGAPTSRERWFLVGHRERQVQIQSPGLPHQTAGSCIDWDLPWSNVDGLCANTMGRVRNGWDEFGDQPFLTAYYGSETGGDSLDRPLRTITTLDRFGLVHGRRFRMLDPNELLRAQGFPPSYYLWGNRRQRIHQVGNSVCPPVMAEILRQAVA